MKLLELFFVLAMSCICCAQTDCFGEGSPINPTMDVVRKGADDFAIKLFTDIAISYPRNSIVIAPYSVWSVLNLAYYGAKGETETQLKTALGVPSKSDAFYGGKVVEATLRLNKGTTFNKADKAYFSVHTQLRDCAINKLTELENVDFANSQAAADKINGDISLATKGKINKFLSPGIIANAEFVLINAVYFKGLWLHPFVKTSTQKRPFYDETGKNISTATMMITQAELPFFDSPLLQSRILQLPYEESNITMLLILPKEGQSITKSVLPKLTSDVLDDITANLQKRVVSIKLPRFKMTTKIADELKAGLKNLGVNDLFSPAKADLTNFITSKGTYVDSSLHQATIEVTEEGTVASAVTGLLGTRIAADITDFNANRPFIFLIRDISQGVTLFIGVLRNPNHTSPF
ncbi:Glia-derived nexin [Armadillidium nasatum]|uniref:Glia-derived nexin n=1 Tax=Armadillidium nasatum TaxID=96803 RepID=A0A5N5TLZ2_9CRUS|nr:Glia-derived nexin [Armadillidium nasatum]